MPDIDHKKKINIFKPFLHATPAYVGGKSKKEIQTSADKIYKLSSNENMLGSSPKALEAIRKHADMLYEYPDRTDARLRKDLSAFYHGALTEDHFMATPSGSEMIDLLVRGFTGEGLECIASNPSFQPYFMFPNNHGARTIDVPLQSEHFDLDVEGILSAVTDRTRLIFVTSPNNPTGTYIPKQQMDYLVDSLPEHVILVVDEVYHHFVTADDFTVALPYVRDGKNVIGLNSFSKAYGLAGLRLGYAYGPIKIMSYIRQLWKPFLLNTLAIEAASAALTDVAFIQKTRDHIIKERDRIYDVLDEIDMIYWKSQGNFIMMKPSISDKEFENRMLEEGIMIRPVSGFGADGCVRVTIGTTEANNAFIEALRKTENTNK